MGAMDTDRGVDVSRGFDRDVNLAPSDHPINATADSTRPRTAWAAIRLKGEAMKLRTLAFVATGALALAAPAAAVESPPSGISPHAFATQYSGCLGQLRSKIAQGDFAGIGPFGQHFTGLVNPGAHQGTVGEEEFLRVVIGIPEAELGAFCAQFA
jgi:hypothetical protein